MSHAIYFENAYSTNDCYSSSTHWEVNQILELGLRCGSRFSGEYVFLDVFVECGSNTDFDRHPDTFDFQCLTRPTGPQVDGVFVVPTVDAYSTSVGDCFEFEATSMTSPATSLAPSATNTSALNATYDMISDITAYSSSKSELSPAPSNHDDDPYLRGEIDTADEAEPPLSSSLSRRTHATMVVVLGQSLLVKLISFQ